MTPEERYAAIVETLIREPGVSRSGRGFGSSALKVGGQSFAMLVGGRLVVKLSAHRVDQLVASGEGLHFDGNRGRPLKEWLAVEPAPNDRWPTLAQEALGFVAPNR